MCPFLRTHSSYIHTCVTFFVRRINQIWFQVTRERPLCTSFWNEYFYTVYIITLNIYYCSSTSLEWIFLYEYIICHGNWRRNSLQSYSTNSFTATYFISSVGCHCWHDVWTALVVNDYDYSTYMMWMYSTVQYSTWISYHDLQSIHLSTTDNKQHTTRRRSTCMSYLHIMLCIKFLQRSWFSLSWPVCLKI
jgi:hypothetical protein